MFRREAVVTAGASSRPTRPTGSGSGRTATASTAISRITNVEGTIYPFQAQETGRPYTITDTSGRRVSFDRGRLLTTIQVDTKGDDDLSNDELIEDRWSLLADNGAHPFFHVEGEWCGLVQGLLE